VPNVPSRAVRQTLSSLHEMAVAPPEVLPALGRNRPVLNGIAGVLAAVAFAGVLVQVAVVSGVGVGVLVTVVHRIGALEPVEIVV